MAIETKSKTFEVYKSASVAPLAGTLVSLMVEVEAPTEDGEYGRLTITPKKGAQFLFRRSDPELTRVVGSLICEAADLAIKEKF